MIAVVSDIHIIETPDLGDRSYLVASEGRAAVIDPQRDIGRITALLDRLGLRLDIIAETHIHNDYLTGGYALARESGATYAVSGAEEVDYERHAVMPGDTLTFGGSRLDVLATPGHTPTHLAYALAGDGAYEGVFTGGSLLYGTVGRTDLISPDLTESLTRQQYHSVRSLFTELPEPAEVFPTHGFGSFCASGGSSGADASTIGQESRTNLVATSANEDAFVETVIAGLGPYPTYYRNMGPGNRRGPAAVRLDLPPTLRADDIRRRLAEGEWILDLRGRRQFADEHIPGTFNFEFGDSLPTYLGWVNPDGIPMSLLASNEDEARQTRIMMARIGLEVEAAAVTSDPTQLTHNGVSSYPVATWTDLSASGDMTLLDVRQPDEYAESHLGGAVNVPFYELPQRLDDLPPGELWVYCRSGYRAAVAASMIAATGRSVCLIDDHFDQVASSGLPLAS